MSQVSLPYGGGVAADSQTGRYATAYSNTLYVYNANDSLYDVEGLTGCAGELDSDPGTGRFFVSSQCTDHLAVYSQAAHALVANIASAGVGSWVVFDPSTGNVFQNLTPNFVAGYVNAPLVVNSSYGTSIPISGFVRAADGALGRLYVSDNDGSFKVRDSRTYATLKSFASTSFSAVAADTASGVFYASTGNTIQIYDASTYALLGTLTLSGAVQNMKMVPGDDRLYAVDGSRLYVIRTR
jgi:hypothetical protein